MSDISCFHCGEPVPDGSAISTTVLGEARPMCCHGCAAVASTIVDSGLEDYYRYRTESARTAEDAIPDVLQQSRVYDEPEVQRQFVQQMDEHEREAMLILEGIVCPACVWLNERTLKHLPGVVATQINYDTRRARVRWDETRTRLSDILDAIRQIGYQAHPYDPQRQQSVLEKERKQMLLQLGVSAVLGMQVMMISAGLYVGEWRGMEIAYRDFFQWLCLALTLPVVLYSARAFFIPAWRDLRRLRAGMDVPVSLGISLAFAGSVVHTVTGEGHVYYDSVVMFTFFLLTGRYLELMARKRANEATEELIRIVPAVATRIRDGAEELVPVARLEPGDRVLVRPGEAFPADGPVIEGTSSADESLVTGESLPSVKVPGDSVIGGSINVEGPLVFEIEQVGADTVLSHILRVLEQAQSEKPRLSRLADRAAGGFVIGVILLAVSIAGWHYLQQNPDWFSITLAVLVVTCPCALSLATPAALVAASSRLMKLGLLTLRGSATERLARVDAIAFDKTGTLTEGSLKLNAITALSGRSEQECLALAAALEQRSEHPLARAILEAVGEQALAEATDHRNFPGMGVCACVDGQDYILGNGELLQQQANLQIPSEDMAGPAASTSIWLADRQQILARLDLSDSLRADAPEAIAGLRQEGLDVLLLSGDQQLTVSTLAKQLGVTEAHGALRPEDKLQRLQQTQGAGHRVVMIGDGINDAPVLAGADVSIAIGSGTQLARASADMVLLSPNLSVLPDAIRISRKTLGIIRQNITWAIGYNLLALPAAATGLIAPWMAAIGMSLSSLLVVLNALRVSRT